MSEENFSSEYASPVEEAIINASDTGAEETHALRWRRAILRLSEAFMDAADERRDLSPILLEALHNALDNLLVYGEADDLMVLEEWLSMEEESKNAEWRRDRRDCERRAYDRRFAERRFSERRQITVSVEIERRVTADRRLMTRRQEEENDRRQSSRRSPREWNFDDVVMSDPVNT
jgi:hypothetical protein